MIEYHARDFINESKPYRSFFCAESREIHMHSHDFWEIVYVYEGIGRHYTLEGSRILKEGDFLVLSPGVQHTITSSDKWVRVCNCLLSNDYFHDILKDYLKIRDLKETLLYDMLSRRAPFCLHLSDNSAQSIRNFLWTINHEYVHILFGSEEIVRNSLNSLLVEMTRIYEASKREITCSTAAISEIENLMKYMRSNLSTHLSLELLSAQIHLSPEYLSRSFKKHTGKNISHLLLEIRMEKARQLLRTTIFSIGDISERCGYSSIGNFQKSFKKIMYMSPSQYRKICLQKIYDITEQ